MSSSFEKRLPSVARAKEIADTLRYVRQEGEYWQGKRKRHPVPQKTFVYVLSAGTKLFKIGMARDVQKRIANLQVGCPDEIQLVRAFAVTHPRKVESFLHRTLSKHRVRGEWFELPAERIRWLQSISDFTGVENVRVDNSKEAGAREILTRSLFLLLYHKKRLGLQEITKRFAVSPQFISLLRAEFAIERASRARVPTKSPASTEVSTFVNDEERVTEILTESLFLLLYHKKRLSLGEIAERFAVSPEFISQLQEEFAIEDSSGAEVSTTPPAPTNACASVHGEGDDWSGSEAPDEELTEVASAATNSGPIRSNK